MNRKRGRRWLRRGLRLLVVGCVVLNVFAYIHAGNMLFYVDEGQRMARPEALTLGERFQVLLRGVQVPRPVGSLSATDWREDCQELTIKLDGSETRTLGAWYVPIEGASLFAVLFHGYAAEKTSLLPEADVFLEMGCSVLLVDFRGSGGSSGSHTTLGFEEARDVAAAVDLVREVDPEAQLILYGQSMGAVAILRAIAHEGVEADGVVLESVFDSLLQTTRNRFHAMGVPSFPAAECLVFWGGVRLGYNGFRHRPDRYARVVKMPVLFLHGDRDPRATVAEAKRVYAQIEGAKEFVTFPSSTHDAGISSAPQIWKGAVRSFVESFPGTEK